MPTLLRVLAVAAALALALGPAARAQTPPDGNKLDGIREEVKRLEAEGSFEAALKLLRAVVEDSLDPLGKLERQQRIDGLAAKEAEQYAKDRARATELEKEGKFAEAAAALDRVASYGSRAHADETKAEQARLAAAAAKADAAARAKEEGDKKKRAADAVADAASAKKAVFKWLEQRKQLACSKCRGSGHYNCPTCEGAGKVRANGLGTFQRLDLPQWVDCGRCKASGQVTCGTDNCGGTGYSKYKLEAVLWAAWPKAFRERLEGSVVSKKNFVDRMIARSTGGPSGCAEVEAVYDMLRESWFAPTRGADSVSVTIGEDGIATASYVLKVSQADHRETTRWTKTPEGTWSLVPPDLGDPGAQPAGGKPKR